MSEYPHVYNLYFWAKAASKEKQEEELRAAANYLEELEDEMEDLYDQLDNLQDQIDKYEARYGYLKDS